MLGQKPPFMIIELIMTAYAETPLSQGTPSRGVEIAERTGSDWLPRSSRTKRAPLPTPGPARRGPPAAGEFRPASGEGNGDSAFQQAGSLSREAAWRNRLEGGQVVWAKQQHTA